MHRISGDTALSQYLASTAQSKQTPAATFQQFLASAAVAIPPSASVPAASSSVSAPAAVSTPSAASGLTAVTASTSASSATITSQLNAALSAYGITMPPALRISSGSNGLELEGDDRDTKFQAMLQANPALAQNLQGMLSQATLGRKTALDQAMQSFGGANPSPTMNAFLADFSQANQPKDISISFNGGSASVQEMGANGWQPVKTQSDFSTELLAAYAKYLVKYGVTDEKKKDQSDNDADIDLLKKLAKTSETSGVS